MEWRAGRGKLGPLAPLLGAWVAEGDSDAGAYRCERRLTRTLGGAYIQLEAAWAIGQERYEELALFGMDSGGSVRCWSFTSDKRQSLGTMVKAGDLGAGAIAFEAEMPAGLARTAYWPDDHGFGFAVESRGANGWDRFVEHAYRPAEPRRPPGRRPAPRK